jgi:uncharacterized protein (DUF302 family)
VINTISVIHVIYSSDTDFDTFVSKFEGQLGRHDISAYQRFLASGDVKAAERSLENQEGPSGLMLFSVYDHGVLLHIKGAPRQARQYVVGNPLYAARMTEHDIRAGLYAPLRVFVYAEQTGKLHVEYDLPSSLFGQFHNERIDAVALDLDKKLADLIAKSI